MVRIAALALAGLIAAAVPALSGDLSTSRAEEIIEVGRAKVRDGKGLSGTEIRSLFANRSFDMRGDNGRDAYLRFFRFRPTWVEVMVYATAEREVWAWKVSGNRLCFREPSWDRYKCLWNIARVGRTGVAAIPPRSSKADALAFQRN